MNGEQLAQLRMIGESAADFALAQGATLHARRVHEGESAWVAAAWREMAALGWLQIAVPEAAGGLGLGAAAVVVVAEEAGRALMMPPLATGMAAAALLADVGSVLLEPVMAGDVCVALAGARGVAGSDLHARLVPDGGAAGQWLVAWGSGEGFELRLLDMTAPGIQRAERLTVDGSHVADARIEHSAWVDAQRLHRGGEGQQAWRRAAHLVWLGDAAYLCGLMDAALRLALDYLKLRRQFGVPIGSFQALQHRATACHVDLTATRALVHEAARAFGSEREAWASAACIRRAAAAALRVTREVVQFHGAIGFAHEHDAGLYLRRAMTVGARHACDALAALQALAGPD